jgi:group I intron endonuclease
MDSGIYSIVNIVNNKVYIGSAIDFEKRWKRHLKDLSENKHCNIHLQRAYLKYGESNFRFNIVEKCEYQKDIILEKENYYIDKFNSKDFNNGYNIADASFGDIISSHPNRDLIIEKIKFTVNSNLKEMSKQEKKEKWGRSGELNGMFGKTHSKEARQKMSNKRKGNQYAKGSIRTEAHKQNLSRLAKERVGDKNGFYNKHHSDETKKLLSNKMKGRKPTNMKKVEIDNIIYESISDAARKLNCSNALIIYRIKSNSEKYNNYKYL